MKIKGKRVLKNGAVAGYVWKDRKWKWRIIKGPTKKRGGGRRVCSILKKKNEQDLTSFEKAYYDCCEKTDKIQSIKTNKDFSKEIKKCIGEKYREKELKNEKLSSFDYLKFNEKYKIRKSYFSPTIAYEDKKVRRLSSEVKKELRNLFN